MKMKIDEFNNNYLNEHLDEFSKEKKYISSW